MTYFLAGLILLSLPIFIVLLKRSERRRFLAFGAIGMLPLLTNLPLEGFIYGWSTWNGISRGFNVSLVVILSLALIATRQKSVAKLPFWALFWFYGITLFVSVFFSSVWLATVFVWWQFLSVLIVFAAVGGEGHRPEIRNSIIGGFALGLIYQAAYIIPQKLTGVLQAAGTFEHQNILGHAIELTLLPIIAVVLGGDRRKILLVAIAGGLICVAGSGSRGSTAIVGAAIVLLILLSLVLRTTSRKIGMAAAGVLALAAATPIAIGTLNDRFQEGSFITEETERENFENIARSMANSYLLGVGANQFVFVSNRDGYADRFNIPWQVSDRSVPVHNAYLLARAETGWLSEAAFIMIIIIPMIMAIRSAFRYRKIFNGDILVGSAVAIFGVMIHSNYEFAIHLFSIQVLFYINLGLIAAELQNRNIQVRRSLKKGTTAPVNSDNAGL